MRIVFGRKDSMNPQRNIRVRCLQKTQLDNTANERKKPWVKSNLLTSDLEYPASASKIVRT